MKTRKLFWLVALSIMIVIFAACDATASNNGDGGNGDSGNDANASSAVELSQSETIEAAEFGGSITVNYPEGWFVQGEGGAVIITSNEDAASIEDPASLDEIPAGTVLVSASVVPAEMAGLMGAGEDSTPADIIELFSGFMAGEDMPEFGEIEEIEIDGNPAARTTGSTDLMSATMYAIEKDGNFTFAFGVTRPDEADANAEVIQAIAASMEFTASE